MASSSDHVSCRISTRARDISFEPPAFALHAKIVASGRSGSLYCQSIPPGPIGRAAEWLEPLGPTRLEFGSGHVLRAEFDPLPEAWLSTFAGLTLEMLRLEPDGSAIVSISGERDATARFVARLGARDEQFEVRRVASATPRFHLLTAPQEEAIAAAIEHGYYAIPRPINLHELAAKLGVSPAALSERLRRAEARIIQLYASRGEFGWSGDEFPAAALAASALESKP